jgi:glycine cleavage system aminomethyltransferase T
MRAASIATFFALLFALGGVSLQAQSQNTAQIQGVVLDASRSTVPGAEIRATQTDVQTGIVLQVSTSATVDVSLSVGRVNERIQVEGNALQVETQASGVANVMENRRIVELPLNGRLAADLIQLTPGVKQDMRRIPRR